MGRWSWMRILPGDDLHTKLAMPIIPRQVTVRPRPTHLPADPCCEVSITLVTQQAGTAFPSPQTAAFPQDLLSKPAKGAQPPTRGVTQAAQALAGRATAALQIPTGAQTVVTGTIKHIRTSRRAAVPRTALLAGCLLRRAFSLIQKVTAVALPAQGSSGRAGSSGAAPVNCREAAAAQSCGNGTVLLRSHNLLLAQLMRAGSRRAHTGAQQDPQRDAVCVPCLAPACITRCPSDTDSSSVLNPGAGVQASDMQHSSHTKQRARESRNTCRHRHTRCEAPCTQWHMQTPSLKPDFST